MIRNTALRSYSPSGKKWQGKGKVPSPKATRLPEVCPREEMAEIHFLN